MINVIQETYVYCNSCNKRVKCKAPPNWSRTNEYLNLNPSEGAIVMPRDGMFFYCGACTLARERPVITINSIEYNCDVIEGYDERNPTLVKYEQGLEKLTVHLRCNGKLFTLNLSGNDVENFTKFIKK